MPKRFPNPHIPGTIESGVVSSALCTRHVWIVDRDGSEFRDLTVALADGSAADIDRATDVQKVQFRSSVWCGARYSPDELSAFQHSRA